MFQSKTPNTRIAGDITGTEAVDFTSTKATLSGDCQDKDHLDLIIDVSRFLFKFRCLVSIKFLWFANVF